MKKTIFCTLLLGIALFFSYKNLDAKPEIPREKVTICHGLSGPHATWFGEILEEFNASQDEFEAVALCKKGYLESYQSAKCGTGNADLYMVSEFGTPSLILKGKNCQEFTPVSTILPTLLKKDYLAGLDYLYGDPEENVLYALPFNPSMGIAYYNKEIFEKSGLDPSTPLETWDDIEKASEKIVDAGFDGFTFPWTAAYTLEFACSQHGISLTSGVNGFKSRHPRFNLSEHKHLVDFFQRLHSWHQRGIYKHISSISADVEKQFAKGTIGILMQGSGRLPLLKIFMNKEGRELPLSFGPLPHEPKYLGENPLMCPKIGGCGIWASRNTPGTKALLEYLVLENVQAKWSSKTGYLPTTKTIHEKLMKGGAYKDSPHALVAVNHVLGRKAGPITHTRLPEYDKIRGTLFDTLFVEFLKDKEGKAEGFLAKFSTEANKILIAYEKKNPHLADQS